MPSSIPHQKFCFYHLPTRGRAGIKLGDAWYVSNVSIIFDWSMLLYYIFWMFMGFIKHFYIILELTYWPRAQCQFLFFPCFSVPRKRNIKRSPNGMKPAGTWFLERKQSRGLGVHVREATREARGSGARPPPWACPPPSWLPWRISFAYIYQYTLKPSGNKIDREFHRRKPL